MEYLHHPKIHMLKSKRLMRWYLEVGHLGGDYIMRVELSVGLVFLYKETSLSSLSYTFLSLPPSFSFLCGETRKPILPRTLPC